MAKEICISSTPHETRLAILEDDQLAEIYYERENEYTLAGSIYNGRVTRVLPGMQSAFVDVGLERDAFLYVTDFVELEDQEDSDEVEKAAATGQAPREIRHTSAPKQEERGPRQGQRAEQKPEQRPEQRQEQKSDQRQDRGQRDRRPVEEVAPLTIETEPAVLESAGFGQDSGDQEASGGRRWRGRRHRRGARGPATSPVEGSGEFEESTETAPEASAVAEATTEIQASAGESAPAEPVREPYNRSGRQSRERQSEQSEAPRSSSPAPVPFVLPGESLSKYGGTPAAASETQETAAPPKPAYTAKPSTLIEVPLEWDGSGLLPGESISKHRGRQAEPVEVSAVQTYSEAPEAQEEFETEAGESTPPALAEFATSGSADLQQEHRDSLAEEAFEPHLSEEDYVADEELEEETLEAPLHEAAAETEPEPDASASHHIDPAPPQGFRLFDLIGGGKKKKEEEEAKKKAASVPRSSYAPGVGHVEEEVIDGDELEGSHHGRRHKAEEDLDVYEEETLPTQARSGDLGEMLQEAHLDHRIQLNFDEKDGDEDGDEDDAEEGATAGTPAAAGQQRRDRNVRGRRGRGAPQQGNNRRGGGPSRRSMQTSDLPIISDLLKPGQEILVQIAKEPIAKKGARITSHIALPGRFLVFMPTVTHVGVSRKIESDEERHRLKRILVHERGESTGGFIVRTAAEGASEEELRADLRFLMHLWDEIKNRSESSKSPALIYHDLSLIERILRDQVSANFSNIWVDSEADYERIVRFLNRFSPNLVRRVKLYTKEVPLFEHFGIQDEISKALRSKVWLKSGGSIVINQTEALVAIDINTGKYVGKSARLEDTIVKTNLDAVPEIVRQIRLRDLGGIIVIDFIDMDDRKNRFKVLAALEEALKSDRAPTKVLQFNDFGLVAITRKRVKQSLERTLSVPCPTCQATGMVKSAATVCNEIYIELRKMKKHFEGADVMVRVNPETVKVLKANNGSWLTEFEELVGKNILVKSDATLHPEQFDIQG